MRLMILGLLMLSAGAASAQECEVGSPDIFEFQAVYAERKSGGTVGRLEFVNRTGEIIRMAHVTASIRDKLGVAIGTMEFPIDDVQIPKVPGAYFFKVADMDRLATLKPDRIEGTICTTRVLYQSGEAQTFD